jgi:phosphatidylserine decarboxylase
VSNIRRLFNLNERVVLNFMSREGRFSVVFVGAANVGHMTIKADPSIVTNRWMWHAPTDRVYTPAVQVKAGDELGMFHLGSTVVCIYDKSLPAVARAAGSSVQMGQSAN